MESKGEVVLVKVDNISKKFCRNLKLSLWYGLSDVVSALRGRDLTRVLRKDEFWALRNISFELKRGECLGLIGHNGAGKSTLLKILNGLILPDSGAVEMRGTVGALIELGAGFNPILTGRQNVFNNGAVLGFTKRQIEDKFDEIVAFAEIGEFIDMPVQNYSSGMKVKLGFAIAAQMEPDILIIDEVLAVGDAAFRVKCFNRIDQLINRCAVIFVSHNMPQVTRICNKLLLLSNGELISYNSNMSQVISKYYSLLSKENVSFDQGTGDVGIHDFQILNSSNERIEKVKYSDPIKIKIIIDFKEKNNLWKNPRLLITIADGEGANVAQIFEQIPILGENVIQEIDLLIEKFFFNTGKYMFTVNILLGERGRMASVRRDIGSIMVEHGFSAYAPILIAPQSIINQNKYG